MAPRRTNVRSWSVHDSFSGVLLAGCLLLLTAACGGSAPAEPPAEPAAQAPGGLGGPPLEIARGRDRGNSGSLAAGVLERLDVGGGLAATPPGRGGPSTNAFQVPRLSESAIDEIGKRLQSLAQSDVPRATDADLKKLADALSKSLSESSPAERDLTRSIFAGRWPPEFTLGSQDQEVRHGRIGWYLEDSIAAVNAASARRLPLVVVFCENQDEGCGRLNVDVMRCPIVNRFAGHAVFLWVRPSLTEGGQKLADALGVTAYPSIAMFTHQGARMGVAGSVVGLVAGRELASLLAMHLGAGGQEDEAQRLARDQDLFGPFPPPNACGDVVPPSK